jgi:four helix bundle protein
MFGFEKLDTYKKAREFNLEIRKDVLSNEKQDRVSKDQLRRAAMSIMLNIAEGSSRFSKADERNFYVISRGSLIESVAILDLPDRHVGVKGNTKMLKDFVKVLYLKN